MVKSQLLTLVNRRRLSQNTIFMTANFWDILQKMHVVYSRVPVSDLPSPTVLPWDPRFWNKSHGLAVCFENPTVNSKMEKNKNIYFQNLHRPFSRKKKCLFSACTTVVFSTLICTDYGSIIKEIKVCSDQLGFFISIILVLEKEPHVLLLFKSRKQDGGNKA